MKKLGILEKAFCDYLRKKSTDSQDIFMLMVDASTKGNPIFVSDLCRKLVGRDNMLAASLKIEAGNYE